MTATDTAELRLRPDRTERLEALLLGAGPHLVPVVDIGTAPNGDLLVVLPVPAARLTMLLESPGGLTAGEAVTVLVPLAQALGRLHASGVAHGGIRADAVLLDADGSPSWAAPVAPALLRRGGPALFAERVAADVDRFHELCAALLASAGPAVQDARDLDDLARALYAAARAEPVRLVRPAERPSCGTPARLVPAAPPVDAPPGPTGRGRLPELVAGLRAVRARVWVALGGAVALLVAALVLLPGGAAPAAAPARTPSRVVAAVPPAPVAERSLAAGEALVALLSRRDRCLERGSEACLREVDATGSPVLAADLAAVRSGTDGVRVDPGRFDGPSASGGTALATAGGATVLAVRQQNGWRLRDVVAEPPAEG